jgi:DoxX-like family
MPRTSTMQPTPLWKVRTGYALSGVVALFLLSDAIMKLMQIPIVLETTAQLGWPIGSVRPLGVMLLLITVLYLFPGTSMLGAILLTGYLGGAVATHVRLQSPLFSHTLFGVYLGIVAWGGLYLRDPRLQSLLPLSVKPPADQAGP